MARLLLSRPPLQRRFFSTAAPTPSRASLNRNVVAELRSRGLVDNVTSGLEHHLASAPRTVYLGIDPTADGIHIGNLVSLVALRHLQNAGHKPILLMGGATALIGDPSGKSEERQLLAEEQVKHNTELILEDCRRVMPSTASVQHVEMVNNWDWLSDMQLVAFMRDIGKHFRMGAMLGKDSVRSRLGADGSGMSLTEFMYQCFQSFDFQHLFQARGCTIQVGGSDQWGNITAGVDLIRKVLDKPAFGLTTPLLTNAHGEKLGKSAGNTVWLSPRKTSPYDFYQYFLRTPDDTVMRLLRQLTFVELNELEAVEEEQTATPEQRVAQTLLARELTEMVHGSGGLAQAERTTKALFHGSLFDLSREDVLCLLGNVPSVTIDADELPRKPVDVLAKEVGACPSIGAARRLIKGGGLYINNKGIRDSQHTLNTADFIDGAVCILRTGKKSQFALLLSSSN